MPDDDSKERPPRQPVDAPGSDPAADAPSDADPAPEESSGSGPVGSEEPEQRDSDVAEEPEQQAPEATGPDGPEEGAEGEGDAEEVEEILPPHAARVSLPVLGEVPLRAVLFLLALTVMAFFGVLTLGLTMLSRRPEQRSTEEMTAARAAEKAREGTLASAELRRLDYERLMQAGADTTEREEYREAARFYREASRREEEGLPRVLLARYKLAQALVAAGRQEEAFRLTTDLMSLSRPGDELWKNALVTSIDALARAGRWGELHRHLSLLRANTARYPDQAALNRWLAYRRAMSRVQRYLSQRRPGSTPHGMAVPPFGQAPYATRPLAAEDIAPAWGDYGDGTCEVQHELGELAVLAEGAPLAEVLQKVGDASGLRVQAEGLAEHHVTASLSGVPPRQALELVLGSVGLAPRGEDVVRVVPAEAGGGDGAGERPLWALQEFLILYPESARVPEAYCALGFLQMMHGRTGMGLDQLAVLCREHPRSPWSVYGHYLIGRGACDSRQWEEAKRELLLAVDLGSDHELTQPALIWAAHAQVELGEYDGAARCFRRALAFPSDSPLEPAIMYNIAYCLEKSGAPVLETEQRYRELSTRYAGTAEARKADFRLARIALRAGNYGQAVARYEHFLEKWPPGSELTPQACADLMEAYCRNRNHVRAVMLGEVMCRNFSDSAAFGRALPSIWDACQRSGLESVGLEVIEHCLQGGEAPVSRQRLLVAKIRFQIALGRLEEARKTLEAMGPEGIDPDLRHEARLVESRLAAAEGKPGEALRLRRRVALKCHSDPIRRQAMEMMARDYERKNDFASAALVYGGKVPLAANEGTP